MFKSYLKQSAVWKQVVSQNGYPPEPQEPGTIIKVRWEGKRRLVRDRQGQQVVSEARIFCIEAVQPGDILNYGNRDWVVIAVSEIPDLNGNIQGYEVAV